MNPSGLTLALLNEMDSLHRESYGFDLSNGAAKGASARAATPGRTLPSSSSREAPPPVEMCDIFSATPAYSTADTESPPPMMVMHPLGVSSARQSAMPRVPLAKASISNTPMGPFQTTVLHSFSASWKALTESL